MRMVCSAQQFSAAKPLKLLLGEPFNVHTWRHTMSPAPETNAATPQHSPSEGRDAGGRFAEGNPGGPGNPYPRRVAALRRALLDCVTEDDIKAIAKAVIEEAKDRTSPRRRLSFNTRWASPTWR